MIGLTVMGMTNDEMMTEIAATIDVIWKIGMVEPKDQIVKKTFLLKTDI